MLYPCVKVECAEEERRQPNQFDLKEFAKQLAQRKYPTDDNPAVRRLQQRFKSI